MDLEKRLLEDILGHLPIPGQAEQKPEQRIVVTLDQTPERGDIPVEDILNQFLVCSGVGLSQRRSHGLRPDAPAITLTGEPRSVFILSAES